jgi:hypothetical protein
MVYPQPKISINSYSIQLTEPFSENQYAYSRFVIYKAPCIVSFTSLGKIP